MFVHVPAMPTVECAAIYIRTSQLEWRYLIGACLSEDSGSVDRGGTYEVVDTGRCGSELAVVLKGCV
jgi:hypothetical protein